MSEPTAIELPEKPVTASRSASRFINEVGFLCFCLAPGPRDDMLANLAGLSDLRLGELPVTNDALENGRITVLQLTPQADHQPNFGDWRLELFLVHTTGRIDPVIVIDRHRLLMRLELGPFVDLTADRVPRDPDMIHLLGYGTRSILGDDQKAIVAQLLETAISIMETDPRVVTAG